MKAQNCFIDNLGRTFKIESLLRAAEGLPVIAYPVEKEKLLEEAIMWRLDNFHDFLVHWKRVKEADLAKPLILRSDGYVMDGWHRLIKAILEGKAELPAKKFEIDPEPDFSE